MGTRARTQRATLFGNAVRQFALEAALAAAAICLTAAAAQAQSPAQIPTTPSQGVKQLEANHAGAKAAGDSGKLPGKDETPEPPQPVTGEATASATRLRLGPLAPASPPTDLPRDRPVIGLALGGGGAEAMSEIGVIEWFEEHRIPVDVIAGTSMGSIIAALYSTGHTPEEMRHIMTQDSVSNVFRITQAYSAQNFERREESRNIPNAVTIGLKHGASFRNSLLSDTGLNELLDKEFLRYNDQTDFNNLPIPFRCQATNLNTAQTATFSRGSLQDAVRASASIPGVFSPFKLDGDEFVDGAILENLPTPDVKAMKADVVLAVSLNLQPVTKGDLNSLLGVLQRAFAVGIENNEARDRKLANVVITPDLVGFTASDYLKTDQLAERGYAAAEADKAELLRYSLNQQQWKQYLAHRQARELGPPGAILRVMVQAPNAGVKAAAERLFDPLVNQPVDTAKVVKLLAELRSDGRYEADYSVGYDRDDPRRPILLVTLADKRTGPPFLDLGFNLEAQSGAVTRATVDTILLNQDLGGYGSELTTNLEFGFSTRLESEYFKRIDWAGFFVAPRAGITRMPYYIYSGNTRLSERLAQFIGIGGDAGWTDGANQQLRAGWQIQNVKWYPTTGFDSLPNYGGKAQTVRVKYIYDSQDRALVPHFGVRSVTSFGYLFDTPNSPNAPQLFSQVEFAHTFSSKNILLMNMEGASMFNRSVAQPFRYTLGGPLRLSASAIDQYRGTDYFLITSGYLRQIKSLPSPVSNTLYIGAAYEGGQMRAPDASNITRQDVYLGIIAETPLGVISLGPSIGNGGERKLVFTIGKYF